MDQPRQGESAKAEDVAREARDAAGQVVDEVRQQASARLGEQVERASARLGGVSEALLSVGQHLRKNDDTQMAGLADRAAEQVERFSGYLRGKDVDELIYEGERFARRQPALFLGGAFALGLVAARFLKSSRPRQYEPGYGGRPRSYGDRRTAYDHDRFETWRFERSSYAPPLYEVREESGASDPPPRPSSTTTAPPGGSMPTTPRTGNTRGPGMGASSGPTSVSGTSSPSTSL